MTKRVKTEGVMALVACFLFLAGAANAAVYQNVFGPYQMALSDTKAAIYDNLGSLNAGADPVVGLPLFGPLADSFSTGSAGFNLADVKVLISGAPSAGFISVALYSDNSTSPGTLLRTVGSLSDNALPSSLSAVDFPLASSYALAPNTRYWLMLSSTDNSTAAWGYSFDLQATGVAGEYFANQLPVVPLPGAILLFGPGIAGLAVARRRFKK